MCRCVSVFSTAQHAKGLSGISTVYAAGSTIVAMSNKIKLLGVALDGNLKLKTCASHHSCATSYSSFSD